MRLMEPHRAIERLRNSLTTGLTMESLAVVATELSSLGVQTTAAVEIAFLKAIEVTELRPK